MLKIKVILKTLIHRVSHGYVTTHIGIADNELTEALAEEATSRPI